MLIQNIGDYPLNNLKRPIKKLAVGFISVVSRRFCNDQAQEDVLVRIR